MDGEVKLEAKHLAFLIEVMNTPGMMFGIDRARTAVEVLDRLQAMQRQFAEKGSNETRRE